MQKRKNAGEPAGSPFAPLSIDFDAGTPEKTEGGLAAEHREDDVIGNCLDLAPRVFEINVGPAYLTNASAHPELERPPFSPLGQECGRLRRCPSGRNAVHHLGRHPGRGQFLERLDVPRFWARELVAAMREGDVRAAEHERDRRLEGAVAAADDEHAFALEVLRVVKPIEDLFETFSGNSEPPEIPAPAHRHDNAAGDVGSAA
jgi:hypothetical protein